MLKKLGQNNITAREYEDFRKFLEKECGIVLGDNKQYLVSSRLSRLMQEHKIESLGALVIALNKDKARELTNRVVEAMTTNETSWFRDIHPFNTLKERIIPELAKNRRTPIRIWSAACSSGQEPYSISMTLHEFQSSNPGLLNADVQIVATDISPAILQTAEKGRYDDMSMARGLSPERKKKYFKETPNYWQINSLISSRVQCKQLNLLQSYTLLGRFDIIFIRNVLIYFSTESKKQILEKMCKSLNPGGYIFLGGSESITGITDKMTMVRTNGG
ncbi:MAG: protein-glutamate O-methyltransferase CheR, partial [Gammaproteobacteria bacterium]|nr:protein-glutamate O-methyltransferase CheR [Gammaproteobacteria bacterium]